MGEQNLNPEPSLSQLLDAVERKLEGMAAASRRVHV